MPAATPPRNLELVSKQIGPVFVAAPPSLRNYVVEKGPPEPQAHC